MHAGAVPASLLFQGPRGVGKQQLALWLARLIVCERVAAEVRDEPCGACVHCRYAMRGQHPDIHWVFPRPRLKDSDPDADDIKTDLAEAVLERVQADGLYVAPPGSDGIFMAMIQPIVQQASVRPAMARRTVFIVGDAERMVSQIGSDQAANAFLKLLEEPPADTTIMLTSSEPGALLPTIRSRVITVRVPPLPPDEVAAFLRDPAVDRRLDHPSIDDAVARAAGAPGTLLDVQNSAGAKASAERLLNAALLHSGPVGTAERLRAAARHGSAGARGAFTDMLDALTLLLHQRAKTLANAGNARAARRTSQALMSVEFAKEKASGNVSPQLLAASLVSTLHELLVP